MCATGYNQFLEKLIDIGVDFEEPVLNEKDRYRKYPFIPNYGPAQIQCRWVIGGRDGGNCWNDHSYSLGAKPEPNFDALDTLLVKLCPDLLFIDYKELYGKLVQVDENEEHEYYGNHTIYKTKTVRCRELFDYLVEKGLI